MRSLDLTKRRPSNARNHLHASHRLHGFDHPAYADLVKQTMARLGGTTGPKTRPLDVAEAVWRAATDPSCPMQIAAGADAQAWAAEAAAK